MYKTKEIRWFFNQDNPCIRKWFEGYGLTFTSPEERTDFYLPLHKKDVSFKLRQGQIELKQRTTDPMVRSLADYATGYFEEWTKWSFKGSPSEGLFATITENNPYHWTEIAKERIGLNLMETAGAISIAPLSQEVKQGCQIEYTRVQVNGAIWYTFGLEWFGKKMLEVQASLISEIVGDSHLTLNQSKGYASFLSEDVNF